MSNQLQEKSIFLSAKSIKQQAQLMVNADEIDKAIQTINEVLTERKQEVIRLKEEAEAKKAALELAVKSLQDQGISKDMIASFLGVAAVKTSPSKKNKYEKDGVSWSGKGKRPAVFLGLSDDELKQFEVTQ